MKRTRIKICGIQEPETAWVAAQSGADAVGLMFVENSPRFVTVAQAKRIVAALPAFVEPVAVFVNTPAAEILEVVSELGIGTVQLQGDETPDDTLALWPLRVVKAMAFEPRHISEKLLAWRGKCENLTGLMFDAPPPDPESARGGSGHAFDWHALASVQHGGLLAGLPPTILAGGLTPDNVSGAIETVTPYAVDVSSGVEKSRGVKCAELIEAFCRRVREADARQSIPAQPFE